MKLQPETIEAAKVLTPGTVAHRSHQIGIDNDEPLIVAMDALIRYAKAHQKRFDSKLAEDYVLGPSWLKTAVGIRELLNGDGAVAHERGISTDSKDNGVVESMFWSAVAIAGYSDTDVEDAR